LALGELKHPGWGKDLSTYGLEDHTGAVRLFGANSIEPSQSERLALRVC
jgi:hypothetical protein